MFNKQCSQNYGYIAYINSTFPSNTFILSEAKTSLVPFNHCEYKTLICMLIVMIPFNKDCYPGPYDN